MRRRRKRPDTAKATSEPPRKVKKQLTSKHVSESAMTAREREKRSGGHSLDPDVRSKMERLLQEDLDNVVIRTDSNANRAAELRQARAYVRDRDIYFGRGQYDPGSEEGQNLLAHELMHIAQTDGNSADGGEETSQPDQQIEKQAADAASGVLQGKAVTVSRQTGGPAILREEAEEADAPTMSMHPYDITAAHSPGNINAGSFSVSFRFLVSDGSGETILVLEIPDSVSAVFTPLGDVPRGAYRIDDPGGDAARSVKVHMQNETGGIPTLRATFSNGSNHHTTVFKFPG